MRLLSKRAFLACLVHLAACTAEAPDSEPDRASDDDDSTVSTPRADAGKSAALADAGKRADAGVRDAGTRPTTVDAGSSAPHDAGDATSAPKADAGAATGGGDAEGGASAESGRMVGMTAAHNAVRAMVKATPQLPNMVWDPEVAAYAQQWADKLASTKSTCDQPSHRSGSDLMGKGYGENLATFAGVGAPPNTTPQQALGGWAAEVACWTYGTLSGLGVTGTEMCNEACYTKMHSDGCGHYTQVVWKTSTKLGCGVATCTSSRGYQTDIWICNYSPGGNFVGQTPY